MKNLHTIAGFGRSYGFVRCGYVDRTIGGITGNGAQTWVDGVVYLQFTSGVTVKYLPDGKITTTCK